LDKFFKKSLIHNTIRLKSIMISTTEAGTCQPLLVHYIVILCSNVHADKSEYVIAIIHPIYLIAIVFLTKQKLSIIYR